jgi:flagellum-specific peptidoglycan hydrolase FlgJ
MDNLKTQSENESLSDVSTALSSLDAALNTVNEKYNQAFQESRRTITRADDRAQEYGAAFRIMNETLRVIVSKQSMAVNILQNGVREEAGGGDSLLNLLGKKLRNKLAKMAEQRAEENAAKKILKETERRIEAEAKSIKSEAESKALKAERDAAKAEAKAAKAEIDAEKAIADAQKSRAEAEAAGKESRQAAKEERQAQTRITKAAEERARAEEAKREARIARSEQRAIDTVAEETAAKAEALRLSRKLNGAKQTLANAEQIIGKPVVTPELIASGAIEHTTGGGWVVKGGITAEQEAALKDIGVKSTKKGAFLSRQTVERVLQAKSRQEVMAKLDKKLLSNLVKKQVAKAAGLAMPIGIGALFGVAFGLERLNKLDFTGFFANVISGGLAVLPWIGTLASLTLDGAEAAREIYMDMFGGADPLTDPDYDTKIEIFKEAFLEEFEKFKIQARQALDTANKGYKAVEEWEKSDEAKKLRPHWINAGHASRMSGGENYSLQKALVYNEALGNTDAVNEIKRRMKMTGDQRIMEDFKSWMPSTDEGTMLGNVLKGFRDGGISDGPEEGYPVTLHGRELIIPLSASESERLTSLNFNAKNIEFNAKSFIFDYGEGSSEKTSVVGSSSEGVVSGGATASFSNPFSGISSSLNMSGSSSLSGLTGGSMGASYGNPTLDTNVKSTPFNGSQGEWYNKMYNSVLAAAKAKGLPNPEIIAQLGAAQSAQETGYGRHMVGNNAFGIKGQGTAGSVSAMTNEFSGGGYMRMSQSFAAYNSLEESAEGYVDFITKNNRYAGVLNAKSFAEAATAIAAAGYATDPSYAQSIYNIGNKSSTLVASNKNDGNIMGSAAVVTAAYEQSKKNAALPIILQNSAGTQTDTDNVVFVPGKDYPLAYRLKESAGLQK